MNIKNTSIQDLFLIRDRSEYSFMIELSESNQLSEYCMLMIKDEYPYLINDCTGLENVSTWQEYGVPDIGFSRYWLNEYKEIEEIITYEMAKDEKYRNKIINSQYFKFNLVWLLGQQYYDIINTLNDFFLRNRIESIYFKPKNNFINNLIISFTEIYKIKCRHLNQ